MKLGVLVFVLFIHISRGGGGGVGGFEFNGELDI